jgi:hypothetical protein
MGEKDRGVHLLGDAEGSPVAGRFGAPAGDRRTAPRRSLRLTSHPAAVPLSDERAAFLPSIYALGVVLGNHGEGEALMNKPSRRAVVRTGVWAVPVVATAAVAPAMATSGTPPPVTIDSVGQACKLPGHSTDYPFGYRMIVTYENNTSTQQTVDLISLTINHKAVTGFPSGTSFTIDANSPLPQLYIVFSSESSQRQATITYEVDGQVITQTVTFASFNPCKCNPRDADPGDPNSDCS